MVGTGDDAALVNAVLEHGGTPSALLVLALFLRHWLADLRVSIKALADKIAKHDEARADLAVELERDRGEVRELRQRMTNLERFVTARRRRSESYRWPPVTPLPQRVRSAHGHDEPKTPRRR
jgi:hypothetical protein